MEHRNSVEKRILEFILNASLASMIFAWQLMKHEFVEEVKGLLMDKQVAKIMLASIVFLFSLRLAEGLMTLLFHW